MKEEIKFPKLEPNQVALFLAKLKTGHILNLDKELRLGKGEIFHIFNSLEEAKEFARKIIQENSEIESGIFTKKDKLIFYINSFEEKEFK